MRFKIQPAGIFSICVVALSLTYIVSLSATGYLVTGGTSADSYATEGSAVSSHAAVVNVTVPGDNTSLPSVWHYSSSFKVDLSNGYPFDNGVDRDSTLIPAWVSDHSYAQQYYSYPSGSYTLYSNTNTNIGNPSSDQNSY